MNTGKILGGILLISCTTIGGGVLALPTATFAGGLLPSAVTFLLCWFFMTCGALYLLEVTLWAKAETNLISMAQGTLGLSGQILAWLAYMFLLYALICAYLLSSTAWLLAMLEKYLQFTLSINYGLPILAAIIGAFIFLGIRATDYANRFFSVGLIIAYAVLVVVILPHVDLDQFINNDFAAMPATIPLLITTFGSAIVVPTITHYLQRDTKALLYVIIIGSVIPLLVYLLWEFVTLGTLAVPGPYGLEALAGQHADGTQVAVALEHTLGSPYISSAARYFSIFAILTSLIGVALSLFHFLADGLNVSQHGKSGLLLFLLTFAPPLVIVTFFPAGFDTILSFGGIFVALLLGILPALMVWFGRYKYQQQGFRVFGGKALLIVNMIFFSYVICQEVYSFV